MIRCVLRMIIISILTAIDNDYHVQESMLLYARDCIIMGHVDYNCIIMGHITWGNCIIMGHLVC